MSPDALIAAYHRASQLGEQSKHDAQRYADARCVALLALSVEHGESISQIAERVGLTRARVQQMTARARRAMATSRGQRWFDVTTLAMATVQRRPPTTTEGENP